MSLLQLSKLLPLPDSELQQVLEYAATLSKPDAAEHFTNLLGDSAPVIDFISSFNARRADPSPRPAPSTSSTTAPASTVSAPSSDIEAVPKSQRGSKKKKTPLHTPAPRRLEPVGPTPGIAYSKKDIQDDYISGRSGTSTPSIQVTGPSATPPAKAATPPPPKAPPSAAGMLVSDLGRPKPKSKSNPGSRASTPGPGPKSASSSSAKISITGGTPMHGASTALTDLDDAIRALELTTNPSHASNTPAGTAARRCNCVATRHPLQTAAPNCLRCGKVICVKEGLGPCTFCGTPLLAADDVHGMIRELRAERGRERMAADRDAHRRAEVSTTPRPFAAARQKQEEEEAAARAREHRDRLLGFQAQNARRTTVRDEAADFDVPSGGGNMWASPEERARELKRQQKILREMEWNARPDYEKRRQVVSIDLAGGKIVRKTAAVERPSTPEAEHEPVATNVGESNGANGVEGSRNVDTGGAFSRNPLLGAVIRPVYDVGGKAAELEGRKDAKTKWRRVQDDLDDNEAVILDGGIYGARETARTTGAEDEPDCG